MKTLDKLYTDLRRYAVESRDILSDRDIDKAINATVAEFVDKNFGYKMSQGNWQDRVVKSDRGVA